MNTFDSIVGRNMLRASVGMLALAGAAQLARADLIPYPNSGTPNPVTYTFTATASGDIIAYFAGSTASYDNELGLLVNGVSTGVIGLDNQSSALGQSLDLGHANAGDTLVFVLQNNTLGMNAYSDPSLNGSYDLNGSDGHNHVYSTPYTGGGPIIDSIPAGTFVSFEDLRFPNSDFNYNDEDFVFKNVTTAVPEPTTMIAGALLLLPFGASTLRMLRKRQQA